MRIVTVASHQPFLHLFHQSDLTFDVILIEQGFRFLQNWDPRVRPLPPSWELINLHDAATRARTGRYQAAMAHNINDLIDLVKLGLPTVLVMHTSLSSRFVEEDTDVDKETYRQAFAKLVAKSGARLVFVTPTKQSDWNLPGVVITAGLDPDHYPTYTGQLPRLLRVTNHLNQRRHILGLDAHIQLSRNHPLDLVGENPGIRNARPAESWSALKAFYQTRRAFLHTARPIMEDGYNLAILEAMATGMPIVSTANPDSPIIDGLNGFLSNDLDTLAANIDRLMADQNLAIRMGQEARATLTDQFHVSRFNDQWRELLGDLTASRS